MNLDYNRRAVGVIIIQPSLPTCRDVNNFPEKRTYGDSFKYIIHDNNTVRSSLFDAVNMLQCAPMSCTSWDLEGACPSYSFNPVILIYA